MRRSLQALSLIVVTIIVFVTYTMFDVHMLMRRISIHYFSPKVSFHYLSSNILVYFIYGDQTTVQRKRLMNVCRHDASSHIIWCKMSLSSLKLLTFFRNSRWWPPPSWIFSLCEFGQSGVLVVWYLCSVPNLVQIYVIVTEIDAFILQTFIWWRHANLLPVSTFGHVVISAWPRCIFPWNLVQISLSNPELLIFYQN